MDSYTGSSEAELLSRLTKHLPSAGSSLTSPSPDKAAGSGAGGDDRVQGRRQHGGGGESNEIGSVALKGAEELIDAFAKNVDVARLLVDIREHAAAAAAAAAAAPGGTGPNPPRPPLPLPVAAATRSGADAGLDPSSASAVEAGVAQPGGNSSGALPGRGGGGGGDSTPDARTAGKPAKSASRKSREEVEAEAAKLGASGG